MADVCDRCGFPVIEVGGLWTHAEAADGAFCALVMVGSTDDDNDEPEEPWDGT